MAASSERVTPSSCEAVAVLSSVFLANGFWVIRERAVTRFPVAVRPSGALRARVLRAGSSVRVLEPRNASVLNVFTESERAESASEKCFQFEVIASEPSSVRSSECEFLCWESIKQKNASLNSNSAGVQR